MICQLKRTNSNKHALVTTLQVAEIAFTSWKYFSNMKLSLEFKKKTTTEKYLRFYFHVYSNSLFSRWNWQKFVEKYAIIKIILNFEHFCLCFQWSLGELKLRLRTRLTHHLYEEYLKLVHWRVYSHQISCVFFIFAVIYSLCYFYRGFTYYKMSNLDNRIANPDQLLTTDVDKFCDMFTDLYSNISKPMLDIFIYVYRLTTTLGFKVSWKTMLWL